MLIKLLKKISIIKLMLIFFVSTGYSLPLTKTFYTPRENILDCALYQEVINTGDLYRKEIFLLGIGFHSGADADVKIEMLHDPGLPGKDNIWGDIFAGFSLPAGTLFEKRLKLFYYTRFRIPSGPVPGEDQKWANVSLGRNELLTGPGISFKANQWNLLTFNLFYVFREGENDNLYEALNFNLSEKKTWKTLFGFNPFSGESFFDSGMPENDYYSLALSLINSYYYPFVYFGEIYHSRSVSSPGGSELPVEGENVNPVLISGGVKYLFSSNFFIQGSCTVSLIREKGFLKEVWSLGINIFF
jgi:hypothetical protein